jgi:hypothetical protein
VVLALAPTLAPRERVEVESNAFADGVVSATVRLVLRFG